MNILYPKRLCARGRLVDFPHPFLTHMGGAEKHAKGLFSVLISGNRRSADLALSASAFCDEHRHFRSFQASFQAFRCGKLGWIQIISRVFFDKAGSFLYTFRNWLFSWIKQRIKGRFNFPC